MDKQIITSYNSVKQVAETSEIIIKKSHFLGYASHALTQEDALKFIDEVSKKHPEASCICHAYICGMNMQIQKFYDGHEPIGGIPILDVIKLKKLTAVCCAVVRYYGGIKLGSGNLARAFSNAASIAINLAQPCIYEMSERLVLEFDYTYQGKIEYMLKNSEFIKDKIKYGTKISMDIIAKSDMKDILISKVSAITNGNHKLVSKDTLYKCWKI